MSRLFFRLTSRLLRTRRLEQSTEKYLKFLRRHVTDFYVHVTLNADSTDTHLRTFGHHSSLGMYNASEVHVLTRTDLDLEIVLALFKCRSYDCLCHTPAKQMRMRVERLECGSEAGTS